MMLLLSHVLGELSNGLRLTSFISCLKLVEECVRLLLARTEFFQYNNELLMDRDVFFYMIFHYMQVQKCTEVVLIIGGTMMTVV